MSDCRLQELTGRGVSSACERKVRRGLKRERTNGTGSRKYLFATDVFHMSLVARETHGRRSLWNLFTDSLEN
jgi:hypothetical protein